MAEEAIGREKLVQVLADFLQHLGSDDEVLHAILIIHQGEKTGMMIWPPDHDSCAQLLLEDAIERVLSADATTRTISHTKQ